MENQPYTARWGELNLLAGASLGGRVERQRKPFPPCSPGRFYRPPDGERGCLLAGDRYQRAEVFDRVGYDAYTRHTEYDQVVISPGSQLSWDVKVKDFTLNLHDIFYYQQDPTMDGAVSDKARFGGFYNTLGVSGTWDLHDVVLSLGYDHFNFIASSSIRVSHRASDFVFFRAPSRSTPAPASGSKPPAAPPSTDQPVLQDNFTYSLGAFVARWH